MKRVSMPCVAALVVLVAACGNIQTVKSFSTPYQEPSAGPRARIRVVTDGMLRAVPNSACIDWRLEGSGVMAIPTKGFANMNDRKLGMPPSPAQTLAPGSAGFAMSELYVRAGKPMVLDYLTQGLGGYKCSVQRSFVPTDGQDYEAVFFQNDKTCSFRVTGIDGTSSPPAIDLSPASLCRISDNI